MASLTLEEIEKYLARHFGSDADTFLRVIFFLQREANEWQGDTQVRNFLAKLISTGDRGMIEKYMKNVVEDTKKAAVDESYKKLINDLYKGFNEAKEQHPLSENWKTKVEEYAISVVDDSMKDPKSYLALFSHITSAVAMVPPENWPHLASSLEASAVARTTQLAKMAEYSVSGVKKYGTKVAVVTLTAAQLSWEAIKNIRLWWKGEITGKRCAKNIVDSLGSIVAGVGGGFAGAAVGGMAGPVGAVVGGILGGTLSSSLASTLINHLTDWIFDLPKNAALERAYHFLGVHHTADNAAINSAYRQLALKYHPDKGGRDEKFLDLQIALQAIKCSREQTF